MTALVSGRLAVVLPGGMYGPHTPTLMFAANAAELRGAEIWAHSWTRPDEPPLLDPADRIGWVDPEAREVLDRVAAERSGVMPLLIGKSLGSCAAVQAAERGLSAIWITPPLDNPDVVKALRNATAPFLLIGGTADSMWDGELARELSPYVLEIEGADHGLHVPGRLAASAEVLGRIATAVEDFLDQQIWPQRPNV